MLMGYFCWVRNSRGGLSPCKIEIPTVSYSIVEKWPLLKGDWHRSLDYLAMKYPHAYRRGEQPSHYPVPTEIIPELEHYYRELEQEFETWLDRNG